MNAPDLISLAHSNQVSDYIAQKIQAQNGRITFAEYMQHALYAPNLGYYSNHFTKFGQHGDFITAPEIGDLFAKCLATQCAQVLASVQHGVILEIGAGSGQLACDLYQALQQHDIELENYLILEVSAALKQLQQENIAAQCPELLPKVQWLDRLPANPINGIIIANEVLDAMPVTRFCYVNDQLQEYYVQIAGDKFSELLLPCNSATEQIFAANIAPMIEQHNQPYCSELNLWIPGWIKSLQACLQQGVILLFDYGFNRSEYYHPQRNTGTLMCHYKHHAHFDHFLYPGLQDITAHVDFTAVAEAAYDVDLELNGYTNFASFLINCGLTGHIDAPLRQGSEVNLLTSPAEMGELFKAMALTKNLELSLVGFTQFDRMHYL